MKSTCPHCGTTYRIDPRKIPSGGVHARCTRCGGVFEIEAPDANAVSAGPAAAPAAPAPPAYQAHPAPAEDSEGQVELPQLGAPPRLTRNEPPAAPAPPAPPPPAPAPPAPSEPPRERPAPSAPSPPPLFGRPDPHGKARRLARALVSDIAVYNPERRDRGLEQGTLRQEFRDEIRKSWDEYVAQVGESIARGTPYFREALNEILAGGRAVF
jgi:predicted Zn finger-like uncharacterized protein